MYLLRVINRLAVNAKYYMLHRVIFLKNKLEVPAISQPKVKHLIFKLFEVNLQNLQVNFKKNL